MKVVLKFTFEILLFSIFHRKETLLDTVSDHRIITEHKDYMQGLNPFPNKDGGQHHLNSHGTGAS